MLYYIDRFAYCRQHGTTLKKDVAVFFETSVPTYDITLRHVNKIVLNPIFFIFCYTGRDHFAHFLNRADNECDYNVFL